MQISTVERARWLGRHVKRLSRFSPARSSHMVVLIVLVAALALAGCNRRQQAEPTDTPVPPTETPVPPTDTPVPPTDTTYAGTADRHAGAGTDRHTRGDRHACAAYGNSCPDTEGEHSVGLE